MVEKKESGWIDTKKFETHVDHYYDIQKPYRKNLHKYILGILVFDSINCLVLSLLFKFSTFSWILGGISVVLIALALILFTQNKKEYRLFVYVLSMVTAFASLKYLDSNTILLVKLTVIGISVLTNAVFLIDNLTIENAGSSQIVGILNHNKNVMMFSKFGDSKDQYRNLDESN